jgi:hypothetical protein
MPAWADSLFVPQWPIASTPQVSIEIVDSVPIVMMLLPFGF